MLSRSAKRVLLALDGLYIDRDALSEVFRVICTMSTRADILLINPPKEPTSCVAMLLLRLEHSGIDYRLTSHSGDFEEEVTRYLSRYQGITSVVVAGQRLLSADIRERIAARGLEIIQTSN